MNENVGGTAALDTSPSLASVVGEMFGDYRAAEPETEAGAPPAETPDPSANSEGTEPSEPAGDPPAEADPASVPDPSTPEVPDTSTEPDPFEGATPLGYTVDGQSRAFDGITVLKNGGAIVDPDKVELLQRRLGERDHLYEQSQAQHAKYSALERATTWKITRQDGVNPDGTPRYVEDRTLSGRESYEHARMMAAQSTAALTTLLRALNDPAQFSELIGYQLRDPNDENSVVPVLNAQAFKYLQSEMRDVAKTSADRIREHIGQLSAPAPAPAAQPADHAEPTVAQIITDQKLADLTDKDKAFFVAEFPRYVVRDPKGAIVGYDPRLVEIMKERAELRAETKRTATTVTTASTKNAARIAAASIGAKGGKQPPKLTPTKEPERTRADDFDDLWDKQEKAAAGALKVHAVGR